VSSLATRDRLPVSLNGIRYEIAVDAYRRIAVDATRQLNDQGGEGGEQTLNTQYVWKRTAEDWRLGAGQAWFDLAEASSRRRFADSVGVDPWDPRSLTLLPAATARYLEADGAPADAWLFAIAGQFIYARNVVDGGTAVAARISVVDDPAAESWTLTDIINAAGEQIESLTFDGSAFYYRLASANQIVQYRLVSGAWVDTNVGDNTDDVTNLRVVSSRLIGQLFAATEELVEVGASSSATVATWVAGQMPIVTGAIAGPDGVYLTTISRRADGAADFDGVHSVIYRCGVDDTSGSLTPPAPIAALPNGEAVTAALTYSGYIVFGTSKGVRLGEFTATGGVNYGPAIEVTPARDLYTDTTDSASVIGQFPAGVSCLDGDGRYVWFTWPNKVFQDRDGLANYHQGLGRLDLGQLIENLQPAWATDVTVEGRDVPVLSCASHGGRRYFVVQGDGPYGTGDEVVTEGRLACGRVTFGTPEAKRVIGVELRTAPLPPGAALDVYVTDELDSSELAGGHAGTGAVAGDVTGDVAGDSFGVFLELGRGWVATEAPQLRRWTVRALPVPQRQEEIWLPIYLSDEVSHHGTEIVALDPHGEFSVLWALMRSRAVVPLVMGSEAIDVFIDAIVTGADTDVKLTRWNANESWPEGIWFVKCITVT
jgi:hypothetical protein